MGALTGAIALHLCLVLSDAPRASARPGADNAATAKPTVAQAVEKVDASAVKRIVFSSPLETAVPRVGKWANLTIIVVPNSLKAAHSADKKVVESALVEIIKGARPEDAVYAAGLLFSLRGDAFAGYGYAMTNTKCFDELEFKHSTKTMREFILSRIKLD